MKDTGSYREVGWENLQTTKQVWHLWKEKGKEELTKKSLWLQCCSKKSFGQTNEESWAKVIF